MWLSQNSRRILNLSCKIFEHFALQVDPVIEFLQLGSTPFKDSTILVPKLADPPFWLKSLNPPPLNLDPVNQSRSMYILYYLKMFVIEIHLLRNRISSCQQVFYYQPYSKSRGGKTQWKSFLNFQGMRTLSQKLF